MAEPAGEALDWAVTAAVDAWLRWLPRWSPGTHRGRARPCRRCVGSPLVLAAGIGQDTPHQVTHALVSRMHRIIDRAVDEFTTAQLPHLAAELRQAEDWRVRGYDPAAGLPAEYDGVTLDPDPEPGDQPFLFTLGGLAAETAPPQPLPRPPLSAAEKAALRAEIERADACAIDAGNRVCFALAEHRPRVVRAIEVFVEPQVAELLAELSKHLEPPSS